MMRAGLTEEQLEMRRTGIGASEIAAVAGLSRWSSPAEIWETKVRGYTREQTFLMRYGNVLEQPIAELYSEDTGRQHLSRPDTVRSPEHEIVIATPDRAVHLVPHDGERTRDWSTVDRLLQIKAPGWQVRQDWADPSRAPLGVPQEVYAQVTWEMAATGIRQCDVAAMVERDPLRIYTIPFDRDYFGLLLELASRFWVDHVVARKPPPPDASEQYAKFLGRAFPAQKNEVLLEATPEIQIAAQGLREVDGALKALKAKKEQFQNEIKLFIGDATGVVLPDLGKITWKQTKGGVHTDWEAVARDMLDAASAGADEKRRLALADIYREVIARRTTATAGHRRLCKPWSRQRGLAYAQRKRAVGRKAAADGGSRRSR